MQRLCNNCAKAYLDGKAIGFDFISCDKTCSLHHDKLVKSYSLESILEKTIFICRQVCEGLAEAPRKMRRNFMRKA